MMLAPYADKSMSDEKFFRDIYSPSTPAEMDLVERIIREHRPVAKHGKGMVFCRECRLQHNNSKWVREDGTIGCDWAQMATRVWQARGQRTSPDEETDAQRVEHLEEYVDELRAEIDRLEDEELREARTKINALEGMLDTVTDELVAEKEHHKRRMELVAAAMAWFDEASKKPLKHLRELGHKSNEGVDNWYENRVNKMKERNEATNGRCSEDPTHIA